MNAETQLAAGTDKPTHTHNDNSQLAVAGTDEHTSAEQAATGEVTDDLAIGERAGLFAVAEPGKLRADLIQRPLVSIHRRRVLKMIAACR